jgi:hypothetical protein
MSLFSRRSRARVVGLVGALVAGLTVPLLASSPASAVDRPAIQPLPANLESIRAQEAIALYGSPEIRPIEARKTAIIAMGDSEMSGEGVGNYEPGTHTGAVPNWCDRSIDQAVHRTGIPADVTYNVACSGGEPKDLVYGSGYTQWNELNQGENLAIKARNTRIKLVWVIVGANGAGNIEFGPVATDCAVRRLLFQGACWPTYTDVWATRVAGSQQDVTNALNSIKQTMTNAGYLASDYQLVLQSYPSPGSPDVEDNPNFPGWYSGGCVLYLKDLAFARNKAVPLFEKGLRAAAAAAGARYLDASRLFHGYEVCTESPSVRGLWIETGILFENGQLNENAARQSFHPNYRGHTMFASCITAFYNSTDPTATCLAPNSTGQTVLLPGLLEFKELKNIGTGNCLDAYGYNSRVGTNLNPYGCHGGRNQGFWYDPARQTIVLELSHDRCLTASSVANGKYVDLGDCTGAATQKFVFSGQQIKSAGNANLCLGFDSPLLGLWTPRLQLQTCSSSNNKQKWNFQSRNYANPVGYGHDDFIGSMTY